MNPAAAVQTARVTELAASLIRCDTRNPPGGERPAVEPLCAALAELGAEIEIFEPEPGRPSVLGRIGSGDGPTLLVNGHVDVVPVSEEDWSVPPFGGLVRDGLLYGRGACDMKGGIAAALEGMRACRDAGIAPPANIVFHLVADEETGGRFGTEALVAAGLVHADAAVVPEPSELRVGVAERGSLMVEIVVRGRAGHGSDPAAGHSAVADAARIVSALHLAELGDSEHTFQGPPTPHAGTHGGGPPGDIGGGGCRR
ncbi:M20 family metallopeptidase, partial [Amycolatopsis sp. NPDC059090]|uniref:M20 family metallopeptidase n=1 Tax=Amycolatopsis sp. NPDC059090 TaxID=3346723 RepID=UPI00366ABD6C